MSTAPLSAKLLVGNSTGSTEHPEVREKEAGLYSYSVLLSQGDDVTDAIWVIWGSDE